MSQPKGYKRVAREHGRHITYTEGCRCNICVSAFRKKKRDYYHANCKESHRVYAYKITYGITIADYDRMFAQQRGLCAICKRVSAKHMDVDHCHVSKRIRGLLCRNCNRSLGWYEGVLPDLQAYMRLQGDVSA